MSEGEKKGWFARLKAGLSRSSGSLTERIASVAPGDSKVLKDLLKDVNTAQAVRAHMTLSCDQNRRQ